MSATISAAIFGLEGTALSDWERGFFREAAPYGYILFARNCENPAQVKALTDSLRALSGRDELPILIDQEGGRVARLRPPHWYDGPSAAALSALEGAEEAIHLHARLLAQQLRALGINVDCAPVADLRFPGAHDIIGDRAYGSEPLTVAARAHAMAKGLMEGGVMPVLKHIPGHGRAMCDSHEALPVVDAPLADLRAADFMPFKALAHLPMAMTAHVVYTAIDPERMATVSPAVIDLIRKDIGFSGLLMSDDLSMKAMTGSFTDRARAALAAGCDVALHCNGLREEMEAVARGVSPMGATALSRSSRAFACAGAPREFDREAAYARLAALLERKAA